MASQPWLDGLRTRIEAALSMLPAGLARDIGVLQVWTALGACSDSLASWLSADPDLFLLGDAVLEGFRAASTAAPQLGSAGMPGRALKTGSVQVVQNLRIIPDVLHPRSRLSGPAAEAVGCLVYLPIFDVAHPGPPVAVLEALLSSHAQEPMLVASFISHAGNALAALELSLSSPLPQPVQRSSLAGRKPRPVHTDSSPDGSAASLVTAPVAPLWQQRAATVCEAGTQSVAVVTAAPSATATASSGGADTAPAASSSSACTVAALQCAGSSAGAYARPVSSNNCGRTAQECSGSGGRRDTALHSTLSSQICCAGLRCGMPPPALQHQPAVCRSRPRDRAEYDTRDVHDDGDGGVWDSSCTLPPRKVARTLGLCRTKSVLRNLDRDQEGLGGHHERAQAKGIPPATLPDPLPALEC